MAYDLLAEVSVAFQQTYVQQNGLTPAESIRFAEAERLLVKLRKMPTQYRPELVRVVKAKILAGVYVNPLKIKVAADRLYEVLAA